MQKIAQLSNTTVTIKQTELDSQVIMIRFGNKDPIFVEEDDLMLLSDALWIAYLESKQHNVTT